MAELTFHHCSLVAAPEHMPCPFCGSAAGTKVYQTVAATMTLENSFDRKIKGIGRTRKCYSCGQKWRTFETLPTAIEPEVELW